MVRVPGCHIVIPFGHKLKYEARLIRTGGADETGALEALLHNARGPFHDLPRTAGSGYPEPYTRDMMISAFGILASGNEELIDALCRVLETLAKNQTKRGHIPSLAHDPKDLGASDTTPLFLVGLALYRQYNPRQQIPGRSGGEGPYLDGIPEP